MCCADGDEEVLTYEDMKSIITHSRSPPPRYTHTNREGGREGGRERDPCTPVPRYADGTDTCFAAVKFLCKLMW